MAKQPVHGLQQTEGEFQVRGIVKGMLKENAYISKKNKNQKDFRVVNFTLEFDKGKEVFVKLTANEPDKVWFSKKIEENGQNKIVTKEVAFNSRLKFNEEGYGIIGVKLGLEKDNKGKNIQTTLCDFDAVKYIYENLKDGMSVFVKGKLNFNSYIKGDNKVNSVELIPNQISLCKEDIDFEDENYEVKSAFAQQIVFKEINKVEDKFILSANIINFNSIEEAEFTVDTKDNLHTTFKKNLKPYNAIRVHGIIDVTEKVNEVKNDDIWGSDDTTKSLGTPIKREFIITGATPSTLDKDTYSQKAIEEGKAKLAQKDTAKQEFGDKENDFGNSNPMDDEEDMW